MRTELQIPLDELIKLYNTVELVANDFWRTHHSQAHALVSAIVWGDVEDLTRQGWQKVDRLYSDVLSVSPLTLLNPKCLPTL